MQKGSALYPVIAARRQNVNSSPKLSKTHTFLLHHPMSPDIQWLETAPHSFSTPSQGHLITQFLISISQEACIKQCSWLDNGPQRYQVLILGACKCYLVWRKGLCRCDLVKDLETGRLLWIIWGGCKQNVFIRERQREIKHRRGKGDRDTETGGRDWLEWCSRKAGSVRSHQMLEEGGQQRAAPLKCQGVGQAPDTRCH